VCSPLSRMACEKDPVRTNFHTTVQLGELVVAAFDWAAQCSSDPREVPLLATKAVGYLLRRARKTLPPRHEQRHTSRQVPPLDGGQERAGGRTPDPGGIGELLAPDAAGRQLGMLTSQEGKGPGP
jgi:hypothetical protein